MNITVDVPKGDTYAFATVLDRITALLKVHSQGPCTPEQDVDWFASNYLLYNMERKIEQVHYSTPPIHRVQADLRKSLKRLAASARAEETLSGFLSRESVNLEINRKGITVDKDLRQRRVLNHAKRIIRDVIGSNPNVKRILGKSSFGNGASASLKRSEADRTLKWVCKPTTTRATFELMRYFMSASPLWVDVLSNGDPVKYVDSKGNVVIPDSHVTFVSHSVLDTVPKDHKIDRIILKEPELNGFLQKGIGSEIRSLFRRKGINLNQSGVRNSILAREGSISGHLATIDAERASDSLTIALYEELFPRKWFELFMAARTPYCWINGESHELQMMSGMGNGFTFEAESLIFYALGRASAAYSSLPFAEEFVSIHGDDLIVPADCAVLVQEMYDIVGVTVNKAKSFINGPFRESCGGHWYNGRSVKPFYVKKENGASQGDWFWLYNSLLLWLNDRDYKCPELVGILRFIADHAVSMTPEDSKLKRTVEAWKVPCSQSRRAGIWSNYKKSKGSSWLIQRLRVISTPMCTSMYGAYMQSLAKPRTVTAYDLIFGIRPEDDDPWEVDIDNIEAGCRTRITRWDSFEDMGIAAPLWLQSVLTRQ